MPQIRVNLGDVQGFESLPIGSYLGQIDKVENREAREAGKFAQFMVTYAVIDEGDHLGDHQSEFLSQSPKAAFRLKSWFAKFGLGELENIEVDDDTNLMTSPDLVGIRVIFKVYQDGFLQDGVTPRMRTVLVSVEDEVDFESALAVEASIEKAVAAPPAAARPATAPIKRTLR